MGFLLYQVMQEIMSLALLRINLREVKVCDSVQLEEIAERFWVIINGMLLLYMLLYVVLK